MENEICLTPNDKQEFMSQKTQRTLDIFTVDYQSVICTNEYLYVEISGKMDGVVIEAICNQFRSKLDHVRTVYPDRALFVFKL